MKSKKITMSLIMLFAFIFVSAISSSQLYYSSKFFINISNIIKSNATQLTVNLSFFPKQDERQEVMMSIFPEANVSETSIIFNFYEKGELNFEINSILTTYFYFKEIKEKIPLNFYVPPELENYTKDSDYIIVDPYIKNKARQLATNDTIKTLHNLAEYVRKSMTYDASIEIQNSSWIMENKKGSCLHYTLLFIALSRALRIPARFVSGLVYNESEKLEKHAWAEVWLPDIGWIPYDITFGEYGWIDSSHITIEKSIDIEPSIQYIYIGKIETENLSIEGSVLENKGKISLPLKIELSPYRKEVGLNSYIPLEVSIENLNNHYLSVPVFVSVAPEVFGDAKKIVLIKPLEKARIFFNIYVPELKECERGCIAKIAVQDYFGNTAETSILIERGKARISLRDAEKVIKSYEEFTEIDFYCKTEKEFYYEYENISVSCSVKSQRNTNIAICIQEICKNLSLAKNQQTKVFFEVPINSIPFSETIQTKCLTLCATIKEQKDIVGVSCIDTTIFATPQLNISIEAPETKYGSKGLVKLTLNSNTPLTVDLLLQSNAYKKQEKIFLKNGENIVLLELETWKMKIGKNPISLVLSFEDKNNRSYRVEENFVFVVKDVTIMEKLFFWIVRSF